MIVAEQKPISEILESVKGYKNVLVVGCGTCVTVCFAGGEKEVGILSTALRMIAKKGGTNLNTKEITVERQCDREFIEPLKKDVDTADAVLAMGCGAGVQLMAEVYPEKIIFPVLNTKFIGSTAKLGEWNEKCLACGDCILDKTAGICPIARCSKSLLNGPCGGSQNGKCEVDKEQDCAWQLIFDRLKALGKLHLIEEIMPPKDWSTSAHGGVRRIIREDLADVQKQQEVKK